MAETDPELHSYEELAYLWEQWREVSGKNMIDLYKNYVTLQNRAAQDNGRMHSNQGCPG